MAFCNDFQPLGPRAHPTAYAVGSPTMDPYFFTRFVTAFVTSLPDFDANSVGRSLSE